MNELLLSPTASFSMAGKPFRLAPENMKNTGNLYESDFYGTRFSPEIRDFGNAFTTLLRMTAADRRTEMLTCFGKRKAENDTFTRSPGMFDANYVKSHRRR